MRNLMRGGDNWKGHFLNRDSHSERVKSQDGQSLIEVAIIIPFLAILLLGLIEMSYAFTTYIALINATRVGASYASLYPEISTDDCEPIMTDSTNPKCITYSERVKDEILAIGLNPDDTLLTIDKPTYVSPTGDGIIYANCPITATVTYKLYTFTSGMSIPLFGRMGLPNYYTIKYSTGMPIREADDQHSSCLSYNP